TQRHTAAAVSPSAVGVLGGGTATDVTVSAVLTAPGTASGTVSISAPAPLTVEPQQATFQVRSGTVPATHTVPVHITAPAGTPDATYQVTVKVTQSGGPSVTRTLPVSVTSATCTGSSGSCLQDLSAQYTVDGVSAAGATGADFDGTGTSFPAEQLPAPG